MTSYTEDGVVHINWSKCNSVLIEFRLWFSQLFLVVDLQALCRSSLLFLFVTYGHFKTHADSASRSLFVATRPENKNFLRTP
jgi:hypothetical protein